MMAKNIGTAPETIRVVWNVPSLKFAPNFKLDMTRLIDLGFYFTPLRLFHSTVLTELR